MRTTDKAFVRRRYDSNLNEQILEAVKSYPDGCDRQQLDVHKFCASSTLDSRLASLVKQGKVTFSIEKRERKSGHISPLVKARVKVYRVKLLE